MRSIDIYIHCIYIHVMRYDWRADKNERNIEQRGIAFVWAIQVWDGDVLDVPSPRAHSTEPRRLAIGCIGKTVIAVAFVLIDNDETRHIISARHASRQERRRYAIHTA